MRGRIALCGLLVLVVASIYSGLGNRPRASAVQFVIEVRDGETKLPIAGVSVSSCPVVVAGSGLPWNDSMGVTTGPDGIAQLQATLLENLHLIRLEAQGYAYNQTGVSPSDLRGISPIKRTVLMYRRPKSILELILPNDFRGRVRVKWDWGADLHATGAPGQSTYRFVVPAGGELVVPRKVEHDDVLSWKVSLADGTPLSNEAKGAAVGYWDMGIWDYGSGSTGHVFLIGTEADAAAFKYVGEGPWDRLRPRDKSPDR